MWSGKSHFPGLCIIRSSAQREIALFVQVIYRNSLRRLAVGQGMRNGNRRAASPKVGDGHIVALQAQFKNGRAAHRRLLLLIEVIRRHGSHRKRDLFSPGPDPPQR